MLTIPYADLNKYENAESAFHHFHDIRHCFHKIQPPSNISEEMAKNIEMLHETMGFIMQHVYEQLLENVGNPTTLSGKVGRGVIDDIEEVSDSLTAYLNELVKYRVDCLRIANEIAPYPDAYAGESESRCPSQGAEAIKFYFAESFIVNELTNLMLSVISKNNRLLLSLI